MSATGHTVREILRRTTEHLEQRGIDTAMLDAEVLLAYILDVPRHELHIRGDCGLKEQERQVYREMVQRRKDREPVAYIVGYKEFWSLQFQVGPDTLIPRPDTEHLVESTLEVCSHRLEDCRILEIGTGCGAVVISLAMELTEAHLIATDISEGALRLARRNAESHGVSGRIRFVQSDLVPDGGDRVDIIVSNPPYVRTEEILNLEPEVCDFEPISALDGGADGLDFYRAISRVAPAHLAEGGWLVMEMGANQSAAVKEILAADGFRHISSIPDYAGTKRVIRAQRV
jgi:release factor glutamine methyltransferase